MPEVFTYSLLRNFKNCRWKAKLRYEDELVPKEKDLNLELGKSFHEGVRLFRSGKITPGLERAFTPGVRSMLRAYITRYLKDDLMDVYHEKLFEGPIMDPVAHKPVDGVVLKGKIDRIVTKRADGTMWVVETKTATAIDDPYLQRLWTDDQIPLYVYAARNYLGLPIVGVIYDIAVKCQLKYREPETEEEFTKRRDMLLAKSKTGKTTATRHLGETESDYEDRIVDWYEERLMEPTTFRREEILFSDERMERFEEELWVLQDEYRRAKLMGRFYQNTGQCFVWNKRCAYFQACRSGMNPTVIENFYDKVPPHEELTEEKDEVF